MTMFTNVKKDGENECAIELNVFCFKSYLNEGIAMSYDILFLSNFE